MFLPKGESFFWEEVIAQVPQPAIHQHDKSAITQEDVTFTFPVIAALVSVVGAFFSVRATLSGMTENVKELDNSMKALTNEVHAIRLALTSLQNKNDFLAETLKERTTLIASLQRTVDEIESNQIFVNKRLGTPRLFSEDDLTKFL